MKKTILILSLIFLSASFSYQLAAQKITQSLASQVAQNWVSQKAVQSQSTLIFRDSVCSNKLATIYLFDIHPKGFIWISANMEFAPVLAYSFEAENSSLSPDLPAGDFLENYQRQMESYLASFPDTRLPHPGWAELNHSAPLKGLKTEEVVEPMMEVTWGQGAGYNTYTPDNTPTGCVAVAMVQIMRHWEWPAQGHGEHSYTHSVYGDFAVNFDTIPLNWSTLPLNSPSPEIAKIMLYAGIALHMDYAPGGSGAITQRIANLLFTNFDYNEKRIKYQGMADFGTPANWIRIVKNELANGRPMVYNGHGTGGHAFNFDGFDGDYFHVNWGWSGAYNGYFLVSALKPGSNNFSDGQGAVMGIFPDTMMMWDRPFSVKALASDAKVSLSWMGIYNPEMLHYNVYRDGEVVGQTKDRFFTDTTARNGSSYRYALSAYYRTDTADYESVLSKEIHMAPAEGFAVPYDQNFENGFPGWQISQTRRGFNWGTGSSLNLGTENSNHFIGINSGIAGANTLVSDYLISNGFDLSKSNLAIISFDYMLRKWQDVDQLYLLYRSFDNEEWIEIQELEGTKGYDDWAHFKAYLPSGAMKDNIQIAFYYTDNGNVGYGAGIDNIKITAVTNPGVPDFSTSASTICQGTEVIFTDRSGGTKDSYYWDFGAGAEPRYAETAGPHPVVYKSGGDKTVKLILNGLDELIREQALTVLRPPVARFGKTINYKTVTFQNTSSNASAYMWDFGDGVRVTQEAPVHVYALSGDYRVRLIAINHTCENDTLEQLVSIKLTGIEDQWTDESSYLFPNPVEDMVYIHLPSAQEGEVKVQLFTIQGQFLEQKSLSPNTLNQMIELPVKHLIPGSYLVRILQKGEIRHLRFVK